MKNIITLALMAAAANVSAAGWQTLYNPDGTPYSSEQYQALPSDVENQGSVQGLSDGSIILNTDSSAIWIDIPILDSQTFEKVKTVYRV